MKACLRRRSGCSKVIIIDSSMVILLGIKRSRFALSQDLETHSLGASLSKFQESQQVLLYLCTQPHHFRLWASKEKAFVMTESGLLKLIIHYICQKPSNSLAIKFLCALDIHLMSFHPMLASATH